MNARSKSKIAPGVAILALGLILICIGGLSSRALVSKRPDNNAALPSPRHYGLAHFLSDARQTAALFDYLSQMEPPNWTPQRVQNLKALPQPQPLLSQSNYTLVIVTNQSPAI